MKSNVQYNGKNEWLCINIGIPFFVGGEVSLEKLTTWTPSMAGHLPCGEQHIQSLMRTASQFINVALEELRVNQPTPMAGRERYLLAMPVIGIGGGFAGDITGEVVQSLLVLVCTDKASYALSLIHI